MKKKVALLLAFVMVLSLMPMNVFGQPGLGMPGVIRDAGQFSPRTVPHWGFEEYVISIDLAALSLQPTVMPGGMRRTLFLEFEVTGPESGIQTIAADALSTVFREGPEMWVVSPSGVAAGVEATSWPGSDGVPPTIASALYALNRNIRTSERAFDDGPGPQYRFARVALDSLLNEDGTALVGMGGWLHAHMNIRANNPESYLTVRLRAETAAGTISTLGVIVSGPLVGGWANGVNITSRGVVPFAGNMTRLNHIRIQEQAPGRLAALHEVPAAGGSPTFRDANRNVVPGANGTMTHIVRFEAPRHFRWDVGHMFGLYGGTSIVRSNSHAFTDQAAVAIPSELLLMWENPVTGLHEMYVRISVPPRRHNVLGAASTLAFVDFVGLSLIAMPGAPTTGEVAIDVTVGTLDLNADGTPSDMFGGAWNQQGLAQWAPGGAVAGTQVMQTVLIYDYVRFGDVIGTRATPTNFTPANNAHPVTVLRGVTSVPTNVTGTLVAGTTASNVGSIASTERIWTGESLVIPTGQVVGGGVILQPRFGQHPDDHGRAGSWRNLGLVVASRDHDTGVRVEGPATPAERVSGRATAALNSSGDARWLHGGNPSLSIIENHPGALFDIAQPAIYELRPVTDGVRIVDARIRHRRAGGNLAAGDITTPTNYVFADLHATGWVNPETNAVNFVTALTQYQSGAMTFGPRSLPPDNEARIRSLEIGLLLSIEAGFEYHHGGVVEIEVFRNNVYVGTAHVANATDPIVVEAIETAVIYRNQFDVIAMTPVSSFTVTETAAGNLRNNDELWFYVQATQDGRPVNIPQGNLTLFLGDHSVNTSESNMTIEPIRAGGNGPLFFLDDGAIGTRQATAGFRVVRPSTSAPGQITFSGVYVAGPTVPGLDWHVVVVGSSSNAATNPANSGITANSHRFFPAAVTEDSYAGRARFFSLPYSATVLSVIGDPHIDMDDVPGPDTDRPNIPVRGRLILRQDMPPMQANDGSMVNNPFILHNFGQGYVVSMLNPRIFADFIGGDIAWEEATQRITFTGPDGNGNPVTVVLTVNSSQAVVNGNNVDIASFAGASGPPNSVNTIIVMDRSFVPLRFLANAFLLPISFDAGTVILG